MRETTKVLILSLVWALIVSSCSAFFAPPTPTPVPTATPIPSPTPFPLAGQTLRDVTYCASVQQKLDIYFPKTGGPWPTLIYVHGGSWMRGDKSEAAGLGAQMNPRGYAVVSVNYSMYPYAKFPRIIEDVKCAVRFLRAHAADYNLDPLRFGAIGASAGGHLVALLGTSDEQAGWDTGEYSEYTSRVQAVIDMSGPTDMTRKFPNPEIAMLALVAFGDDEMVKSSPITHVTSDDPPFLIIHGDKDGVIPVEQSQLFYDALTKAGVVAQLVIVKNGDHGLTAPDSSATPTPAEIEKMKLDFLDKYLK
jgi:acetyl esterase/lipase